MTPSDLAGTWQVGQLAAATGVSVRTLRHYDQIDLLHPSARVGSGPRRYDGGDARRLREILALRALGLSLAEVADVLAGDLDIEALIAGHLREVDEQIASQRGLRAVLAGLLDAVRTAGDPTGVLLASIKEVTTMSEKITDQQLAELTAARRRMTESLTPGELEEMTERRRHRFAQMDPQERERLAQRRRAVMPGGQDQR